MKLTFGHSNKGKNIPRLLNPPIFVVCAAITAVMAVFIAMIVVVFVVTAPFSWAWQMKVEN